MEFGLLIGKRLLKYARVTSEEYAVYLSFSHALGFIHVLSPLLDFGYYLKSLRGLPTSMVQSAEANTIY